METSSLYQYQAKWYNFGSNTEGSYQHQIGVAIYVYLFEHIQPFLV